MRSSHSRSLSIEEIDALQAKLAGDICALLDDFNTPLAHDINERLRVCREQAVAAFTSAQQTIEASAARSSQVNMPAYSNEGKSNPLTDWFWRLACMLPVLTLLIGFWGIGEWQEQEKIQAIAEVDMALLADNLPPAAYVDEGFEEYLQNTATLAPAIQQIPTPKEPLTL